MKMNKEKQQVVMLVAVLAIIVVVLLFFYRDRFLPRPTGEAVLLAPPPRMSVPAAAGADALYERKDFKALKRFGNVPVRPLGTSGSPDPFFTDDPSR
jgi:hypothetical protein